MTGSSRFRVSLGGLIAVVTIAVLLMSLAVSRGENEELRSEIAAYWRLPFPLEHVAEEVERQAAVENAVFKVVEVRYNSMRDRIWLEYIWQPAGGGPRPSSTCVLRRKNASYVGSVNNGNLVDNLLGSPGYIEEVREIVIGNPEWYADFDLAKWQQFDQVVSLRIPSTKTYSTDAQP